MTITICPECNSRVGDYETIVVHNGAVHHLACRDRVRHRKHECRTDLLSIPPPTILYTMTPQRFVLEIPVEALANLSPDAHTRMLDMLSAWIARHKPPKVETPK